MFDRQSGLEGRAGRLHAIHQQLPILSDQIGNLDFRDDQDFVPLQAADLVAWQARRYWSNRPEPMRQHFLDAKALKRPPLRARLKQKHLRNLIDSLEGKPTTPILGDPMILEDGAALDGTTLADLQAAKQRESGI